MVAREQGDGSGDGEDAGAGRHEHDDASDEQHHPEDGGYQEGGALVQDPLHAGRIRPMDATSAVGSPASMTGASMTGAITLLATAEQVRPLTDWLASRTDSPVLLWASDNLVEPLLAILLILVLASIASQLAARALRRVIDRAKEPVLPLSRFGSLQAGEALEHVRIASARRGQRAEALGALVTSVVRVVIWGFAVLTALGTLGINLGPLIAGAGIFGVAIGFGAQNLVRDLLSGMSMLLEDQYGVGDVVDLGDAAGVVEEVGLRTTRIRDVRGVVWHVPNGAITRVGNMTQGWSRLVLDVGIAYDSDVDAVIALLEDILVRFAADDEVVADVLEPPEIWGVNELGDSSIELRIAIKTVPGRQWETGRRLRRVIKREFDAAGIEIPFPQRTVWHRGLGDGLDAEPGSERSDDPDEPGGVRR
jgi:moderate conductance mechanosensitive channel